MDRSGMWQRWRLMVGLICLLAAGAWLFLHWQELSRESVLAYGKSLPAAGFIAAFLILPLAGAPISLFLVLVGVRFGFLTGMAVTAAGILVHHSLAYRMVHGRFREYVAGRLGKFGRSIPTPSETNRVGFTILFAAIHGPPYTFKLYALALTEIPFRIYFWAGAPVHILFCAVPVGVGSSVMMVDALWLYCGITVLSGIALLGAWWKKRGSGKSP